MSEFEVRRGRVRGGFVKVHHEWYDLYIPAIGTAPFLVWGVLSRYINREPGNALQGKAYPSRDLVCTTLKIGSATFTKAINTLKEVGLLEYQRDERTGRYIYTVHEPLEADEATEVLAAWTDSREGGSDENGEGRFSGEPGAVLDRTGGGSVENPKKIKEIDKEEKEKNILESSFPVITKVENDDEQPRSPWGRRSQSQDVVEESEKSGVSRGLPGGSTRDMKPVEKWNAADLVRYWIRKWQQVYGVAHPRINYVIEGRHMKKFMLEPYGAVKAKEIIDRFFERRSEFENPAYPTIGLHGLRQEWIVRKLLVSANVSSGEPTSKLRIFQSEFIKAQADWGTDMIPDKEAYFKFTGLDPASVEWVDDV